MPVTSLLYEPRHEKTGLWGFQPGPLLIGMCSHKIGLDASNFGFNKKRDHTICVVKTKSLISCAVTVFAYASCWFSYALAHLQCLWVIWIDNIDYRYTLEMP